MPWRIRWYYINTRDKEGILRTCREEAVDGICTTGTDVAVSTIGYVCEKLGLSGLSEEAARRATDKAAMKEAFFSEGVSAARFYKARSLEDVTWAAGELGFPVVGKKSGQLREPGDFYCQRTCPA